MENSKLVFLSYKLQAKTVQLLQNTVYIRFQQTLHFCLLRLYSCILFQEENMTVTEDFSRLENTYQMEAEVRIQPKKTKNVARTKENLQTLSL